MLIKLKDEKVPCKPMLQGTFLDIINFDYSTESK